MLFHLAAVALVYTPHATPKPLQRGRIAQPRMVLELGDLLFMGAATGVLVSAGALVASVSRDGFDTYEVEPGEIDYISKVRKARSTSAPAVDYRRARAELGMDSPLPTQPKPTDRTEELGNAFLAAKARSQARAELTASLEDAVSREDYQEAARIKAEISDMGQ